MDRLFGPRWKRVYTLLLASLMFGILWGFVAVFAASMAANVPTPFAASGATCDKESASDGECDAPYRLFVLLFAAITVPLSCIDLKEQRILQVVMTAGKATTRTSAWPRVARSPMLLDGLSCLPDRLFRGGVGALCVPHSTRDCECCDGWHGVGGTDV